MVTIETIEKLRSYADISYEEAKAVLEQTDGDLLNAVIHLEKSGRVAFKGASSKSESSSARKSARERARTESGGNQTSADSGKTFGEIMKTIGRAFGKAVKTCNSQIISLAKREGGEKVIALPLTAVIIIFLLAPWLTVIGVIVALCFGLKFDFSGPSGGHKAANDLSSKVSDNVSKVISDLQELDPHKKPKPSAADTAPGGAVTLTL